IPKSAGGIDRRNGVDLLALTAGRDDGCLPFGTPGALQGRVRAHTGLVDEEDLGTKPLGARLQLGVVLLPPLGDRHGVALIGAPERLLRCDIKFGQQPTDSRQAEFAVFSLQPAWTRSATSINQSRSR